MSLMTSRPLSRVTAPLLRPLVRFHYGHSHATGGGGHSHAAEQRVGGELRSRGHLPPVNAIAPTPSGPRVRLALGLETARAVTNVGRALESHAEASLHAFADMFESVWHQEGLLWRHAEENLVWEARTASEELTSLRARRSLPIAVPALLALTVRDERTALVKLLGADGRERYLQMLRLDGIDAMAHDGWQIVREVVGGDQGLPAAAMDGDEAAKRAASVDEIRRLIDAYMAIEHGGGDADKARASALFDPRASVLAVGTSPVDEAPSAWSAPAGTLLEVSRDTYLDGVADQTGHASESAAHERVFNVDLLACGTAAAATLHVGNGACTALYVDHLLLARDGNAHGDGAWRILSKTFSPRPWPAALPATGT